MIIITNLYDKKSDVHNRSLTYFKFTEVKIELRKNGFKLVKKLRAILTRYNDDYN